MKHRDLSLTNCGFEHQKLGQKLGSKQQIIGISHDLTPLKLWGLMVEFMKSQVGANSDFTVGFMIDITEV